MILDAVQNNNNSKQNFTHQTLWFPFLRGAPILSLSVLPSKDCSLQTPKRTVAAAVGHLSRGRL